MMEMLYKTLGNSTPRSKPGVFFACHPDDFDRDFATLTDDILRINNCAIWYKDNQNEVMDRETLEITFGQMQLLVIPVTENLIQKPSFALDVLLPFAVEQHIPVLPIITEANHTLAERFNAITDGMQMLNRTDTDESALSYEDKLEKFVNSVLVNNETAEAVRRAFDAYVFLSYRKKDRTFANSLMRRIHENPELEHIAIWFDEYLVPGESFTSGIEKALKQSPIFVMAVTEHLLEEGNYVKEHEYKAAEHYQKIIVPVDMVGLNCQQKQMLREWYNGIPELHDFNDQASFHDRFMRALKLAAIHPGERTNEHDFYIGLAYLMGIDVEVNRERAKALIEKAAKGGYAEASQKLVYMYRNGDGVNRNEDQELFWQKTLVEQRKKEYDAHPAIDLHLGTTTAYFRSLIDMSDLYEKMDRLPDAVTQTEIAKGLYKDLIAEVGSREAERDYAVILNRLGGLYKHLQDYEHAAGCYRESLKIYEKTADEITTRRALRDLSIGYEKLADIDRKLLRFDEALINYRKSKTLRIDLVNDNPTTRARRDLSVISTKIGSVYTKMGMLEQAKTEYEEAVTLDRQLKGELRTLQSERDLSISLERLSKLYMNTLTDEPTECVAIIKKTYENLKEVVELREKVYSQTGKDSFFQELIYARQNLDKVLRMLDTAD